MDTWDTSPLLPVPLDILLQIVAHLPLQSVFALRRTCKTLCAVTRLRSVWAILFRQRILAQHIPHPHLGNIPLTDLSSDELELLTRRTLTLRRNWTRPEPTSYRRLTFNPPSEPSPRAIFLQFLPARANRWLISVRMTARPRTYLLQCWDVTSDPPRCVAELMHADGPYGGVVLNSDPNSPAVLALQSAQTETFSINFDAADPESAFETDAVIDGIRELHLLSGSTLVTRRTDDGGPLCLWDLSDLRQEKLQLLNPSIIPPDDRIQAIHLAHDYALVVRIQSVEIYSMIPRPNILPVRGAPIAYPLAQFKLPWRTDTVLLCEHYTSPDITPSTHSSRPVHLLVRFGSIYPWPVNVLHHYILHPNPAYRIARGSITSPLSPCWSGIVSSIPGTTEYNLPYDPTPRLTHILGSPVRLFGQSAMALGQYGTALWLDNHAEECVSAPSDHGQRLAGKMFSLSCDGSIELCGPSQSGCADVDSELTVPTSSGASMVFGMCDDDAWTRIAMDEEAGRIAIGHTDGAITLLEF